MTTINICKDFSNEPGGRYKKHGAGSGEAFFDTLVQAFATGEDVVIELDGVRGYGASFLEESFGGIVRKGIVSIGDVKKRLKLVTAKKYLEEEIWTYIDEGHQIFQNENNN
ncbi:hypothetical protein GCM10011332_19870 [Terasakiella brassicae]|uniref:DUF4325 domain-containing protein n=1 Tax=Terasakiella brassicae TaxID=1634917 RepID=A0A917C037_9PROT|nr:STAS-like domain-containing protein [Terasakiella brassicae]GGF65791.1 hypothetical protein GCM10011332_19870 [Terasakiella brassicae]